MYPSRILNSYWLIIIVIGTILVPKIHKISYRCINMGFPKDRKFFISKEEEIEGGYTTDIYFLRTEEILKKVGKINTDVKMEITSGSLPHGFKWGVIAGVPETINLFRGKDMDFYIVRDGTIYKPKDDRGYRAPIGYLVGKYGVFGKYETPLLGLLCQASGIATYSAHIRLAAWGKILLSFGARRMHPAITPLIDYAAYIAGFDGVSAVLSAELLGLEPQGTMPHALILIMGSQVEAWKAFDKHVNKKVKRIALIDTLYDEKIEALMAAEALGEKLFGVRIDTPKSRRGDIKEIIREIRWELDLRGYKNVRIIVSGGVGLDNIMEMIEAGADGFGIGTSVSNAPTIDYALDIVEINSKPLAKRGKLSGMKQLYRCMRCFSYIVTKYSEKPIKCGKCGGQMEPLIKKVIEKGEVVIDFPDVHETREYVLTQLGKIRELGVENNG